MLKFLISFVLLVAFMISPISASEVMAVYASSSSTVFDVGKHEQIQVATTGQSVFGLSILELLAGLTILLAAALTIKPVRRMTTGLIEITGKTANSLGAKTEVGWQGSYTYMK